MAVSSTVRDFVIQRAAFTCEYCRVHERYATFRYQVDHVIARKHGGTDHPDNLAYSCAQCNRFKGSDIASLDPDSGELVFLYNPRTQHWSTHFQIDGFVIVPLTSVARATANLLQFNQIDRLLLRQELVSQGKYP